MSIQPPIPEFLWDEYPDDAELLAAVQPMTVSAIPFVVQGGLYDWLGEMGMLIRAGQGDPPFSGTWVAAFESPDTGDPAKDAELVVALDAFFGSVLDQRPNINSHTRVRVAAEFADLLEGLRLNGTVTNPQILEIYSLGGGVPWRQLTEQDITDERARRDAQEAEQARRDKIDQDVAYYQNEILAPAEASYNRAQISQALADAKTWFDQQVDP